MSEHEAAPYWLRGALAPVREEIVAFDLEVEGAIPPELEGLYARNGANPRQGHSGHWFLGDGMIHGVSLEGGRAKWYRNKWVRTPRFEGVPRPAEPDLRFALANTHVMKHAGRILALVENALPYQMAGDLETIGAYDFDGALKTAFTAHPKICPASGELHFFGYGFRPPYLTYHVANAAGALTRSLEIPVRAPTMIHDVALTERHVVFMDLPVVFDAAMARQGTMPFAWSDDYGARLGVLPRGAGVDQLRWVEIEPGYVFHVANAFEDEQGAIVIDVAWYSELWRGGPSKTTFDSSRLKRWRIPAGATRASEQFLDDRAIEFPRVDERKVGRRHDFIYAVETEGDLASGDYHGLLRYDVRRGSTQRHEFKAGTPSEFVFAPARNDGAESEGWLIGFVYDHASDKSDLVILDAQDISAKPVARVKLPRRVPQGFHGSWMPVETGEASCR